ncbi:MAG: alpha-2-macroglobulin family protein, partial [Thermodesulfobacteriota bacterium]|nr:alpha-2-macroglobulin family protein [Thermodesulfobacteriota bacterium]
SRRSSILVHPASFYLGLKTERYVVGPGEKMTVGLIAATPKGRLISDVTTNLVLYRRTWQTVRRKGAGGYYHYISEPTDTVVERVGTKTMDRPLGLDFTIDKGGFYYVAAGTKDRSGRTVASSVGFYAYGGDSAGWERYDHDRIDLVPDKKDYRPGQTATILIKSPFPQATGLLTVERGGVRRYQVFNVTSPSPVVRVKIQEGDSPNVFVSVLLVRGRISDKLDRQGRDPGKPAFKAGYVRLLVKDESSRLKVEVAPDRAQARPGEEVELTVKVADASGRGLKTEVALVVADAALLQLTSENIYFPERLFFAPRSLAVWTTDLRLNLIGRRHYGLKGANLGGGGLGPAPDRYRRRFVSLAFFDPHLVTDDSGLARVKFRLPGNLTNFKIFAVANDNGQKFGTGVSSLRVTKPLLIKPALPNFGGVGDEFTAAIVVHNRSGKAGQATITLSGDNFDLLKTGPRLVNLKANSSMEVGFPVRILPASKAVFRFAAAFGSEWDAAEFGLPLRFPNPLVTSATFGRLKKSSRESVLVPENADPERGFLTLNVSASLIGALNDAFDYLRAYPHQCLEQKTSQVLGALLYLEWRPRLGGPESAKSRAEKRIEEYLQELRTFQGFDGGFSFWPETRRTDPYLSAYVVQVLNMVRNSGLPVDGKIFNNSLSYLVRVLNHNRWPEWYGERERLTARVYMAAVLAEAGRPVAPLVENLYEKRKKLSSFELALLLETLSLSGRDEQVARQLKDIKRRLFGRAVITPREVHFEEKYGPRGLMASRARTNAVVLKALLKADPGNPHLVPLARWLLRSRQDGHWGGTQNNGLVLLALTEYVKVMEETPPEFSLQAVLDLQPLAQADFTGFETPPLKREVPLRDLKKGTKIPLELNLEGKGAAYYTLRLDYAPQEPDLEPRRAGFAVSRTYTRVKGPGGKAATGRSFGRGDLVRVDLTLLVPSRRHWVVLEDLVPAGLEPINFNLPTVSKHLQALLDKGRKPEQYYRRYWYQHREIRHDRVVIYARVLTEGAYTFSYLCRVVTPGAFIAPGPRAEEMYSPEVSGRGRGRRFEIEAGE